MNVAVSEIFCTIGNYFMKLSIDEWRRFSLVVLINEVALRRARLVLGWVTISVCNHPPRSTQPGHPSVSRHKEYTSKAGEETGIPRDARAPYPWSGVVIKLMSD